jgi:glyoxalase family protein
MTSRIQGLHHVTAMCSDPQGNVDFYSKILGLRLVKVTVNYDDPSTYHLYYGDPKGSPGTLLTFFPWPEAPTAEPGGGQATTISFSVPQVSLGFWQNRLQSNGITFTQSTRFGLDRLTFSDHDGFNLELVASITTPNPAVAWVGMTPDYAIHGFHGVTLDSIRPESTRKLLIEAMGYQPTAREGDLELLTSPADIANTIELKLNASDRLTRTAVGSIHHVAFRATDDQDQAEWRERFIVAGLRPTEFIDRNYFRSIYMREPGGILYELATDPPGMMINEPFESLGTQLMLPPWLEPHREEIAASLPRFNSAEGTKFS